MLTEKQFFALVGARIREVRTSKGLSQGEVARRIKSYQQNIARSEAGANLTLDVLFRLAKVLEVEPLEFFRLGDEPIKRRRRRAEG